jgi:hypothetical protein
MSLLSKIAPLPLGLSLLCAGCLTTTDATGEAQADCDATPAPPAPPVNPGGPIAPPPGPAGYPVLAGYPGDYPGSDFFNGGYGNNGNGFPLPGAGGPGQYPPYGEDGAGDGYPPLAAGEESWPQDYPPFWRHWHGGSPVPGSGAPDAVPPSSKPPAPGDDGGGAPGGHHGDPDRR